MSVCVFYIAYIGAGLVCEVIVLFAPLVRRWWLRSGASHPHQWALSRPACARNFGAAWKNTSNEVVVQVIWPRSTGWLPCCCASSANARTFAEIQTLSSGRAACFMVDNLIFRGVDTGFSGALRSALVREALQVRCICPWPFPPRMEFSRKAPQASRGGGAI